MPLGAPMGGDEPYFDKGKVKRIWMISIPVRDLDRAIHFYVDILGIPLKVLEKEKGWAEIGTDEPMAKIALYVPNQGEKHLPGIKTGIFLEVDSIFDFHRRLVDEEVPFILKPERNFLGGLIATFLDPDGNELSAIEDPDHYLRYPQPERAKVENHKICRQRYGRN